MDKTPASVCVYVKCFNETRGTFRGQVRAYFWSKVTSYEILLEPLICFRCFQSLYRCHFDFYDSVVSFYVTRFVEDYSDHLSNTDDPPILPGRECLMKDDERSMGIMGIVGTPCRLQSL